MEENIILWLQKSGSKLADVLFQGISYVVSWLGAIFLFAVIIFFVNKRFGIFFGLSFLITIGVNYLLKIIIHRPRPYVTNPEIINKLTTIGYSFPSGHMVSVTFMVLTLLVLFHVQWKNNKFKIWGHKWFKVTSVLVAICLIITTAIARMYLGQHYLTDLIGGFVLASILFCITQVIYSKTQKK